MINSNINDIWYKMRKVCYDNMDILLKSKVDSLTYNNKNLKLGLEIND